MVKLFVEGGGDNDALRTECRQAFSRLLEAAGFKGRMPRIVACGGRQSAFDRFLAVVSDASPGDRALLLVDSEEPVTLKSPWDHVARQRGKAWVRPGGVRDGDLHFMVQCMEAWIVADREALRRFYGQGFNEHALPSVTARPESIEKQTLVNGLDRATRSTKTKETYDKGRHSFKLLSTLDPKVLRQACPWADRFFATLDAAMSPGRGAV